MLFYHKNKKRETTPSKCSIHKTYEQFIFNMNCELKQVFSILKGFMNFRKVLNILKTPIHLRIYWGHQL